MEYGPFGTKGPTADAPGVRELFAAQEEIIRLRECLHLCAYTLYRLDRAGFINPPLGASEDDDMDCEDMRACAVGAVKQARALLGLEPT